MTMARHKPEPTIAPQLSEPYTASLAQRVEEAEKRLAASETIASTCYWQGALDALNALSRGEHMPEVVGAGVPK